MATQELTIVASKPPLGIDIGPPGAMLTANVEAYNGTIPGPTIMAEVGDTLIVRLINDLPFPTGIHWHGIELQNNADGTPVTQNGTPGAPLQTLGNGVPAGGTYLYKFDLPRAGLFWYHPHHFHSTNRVFRGLYGMIVVTDPALETPLVGSVLPDAADTLQVVLSDITVCAAAGSNPTVSYPAPSGGVPEWLSGETEQIGPTPETLCDLDAMKEDGSPLMGAFGVGDIPTIQQPGPGRTVEGVLVLANGQDPGGRSGTPGNPGALSGTNDTHPVAPGQGLRLQLVNCAHLRYFRLRLTDDNGELIPLKRIGGEGGLLDQPILEGNAAGQFDFKYDEGEILLPPSARADIVAEIPGTATGTLTLWTRDFQRAGNMNPGNWALLPSVPVMHFPATLPAVAQYSLPLSTQLRPGNAVVVLPATGNVPLDPAVIGKPGEASASIDLGPGASIDGQLGDFSIPVPTYVAVPHIAMSTRYLGAGQVIEMQIVNTTSAHHPFHLHGFSFQPVTLELLGEPTFNFPSEFRDTQDVPPGATLTFRIDTNDRALNDGATMGGTFGRWLFHCHIFFHAHNGMISELVVTEANGSERPYVDVGGSWEYVPSGGIAMRNGTFDHPDGKAVTLSASEGNMVFTPGVSSGTWQWTLDTTGQPDDIRYVYITASDGTRNDQTVFRLKIGGADDGSDIGDPHMRTIDGTPYDFQSVGEFVLARDDDGLEVQTRQTPVAAANPVQDGHSELRVCVSLNTAVAARVGNHRVSYQPSNDMAELEFFLDGKRARIDERGLDLGPHRVSSFDADGRAGLRIDYAHHAVVTVTPRFWNSHRVHYLNVDVTRTQADRGLIAPLAPGSWLPPLADGRNLGARPADLDARFDQLCRIFANSWRVTDASSLFTYAPGTSTETFTDRDWPGRKPPCEIETGTGIPNAPELQGVPIEEAKQACKDVSDPWLLAACVFDVATTGDRTFAKHYVFQEEHARRTSAVQIAPEKPGSLLTDTLRLLAVVSGARPSRTVPRGVVTFLVNGEAEGKPVELDDRGRARTEIRGLKPGTRLRAYYGGEDDERGFIPSSSANLILPVDRGPEDTSRRLTPGTHAPLR